jgi:hypothetical protein
MFSYVGSEALCRRRWGSLDPPPDLNIIIRIERDGGLDRQSLANFPTSKASAMGNSGAPLRHTTAAIAALLFQRRIMYVVYRNLTCV